MALKEYYPNPPIAPYRIVSHRGGLSLAYGKPRIRLALGTKDRGIAEIRAKQKWSAMKAEALSEKLTSLWHLYIEDRREEGVNAHNLSSVWKALEPHFGYKLGSTISRMDCREYAAARKLAGKAPSTIRTELEYLRACLHHRYGKGNIDIWLPTASPPEAFFNPRGGHKSYCVSGNASHQIVHYIGDYDRGPHGRAFRFSMGASGL